MNLSSFGKQKLNKKYSSREALIDEQVPSLSTLEGNNIHFIL